MVRKSFTHAITSAFLCLVMAFGIVSVVSPGRAEATHLGTVCRHHEGPDGQNGVSADVCVTINASDISGHTLIEALIKWSCGANASDLTIKVKYIRLHRINLDGTGEIVEAKEADHEFANHTICNYSTDWYDLHTRPSPRWFYSTTAYMIDWHQFGCVGCFGDTTHTLRSQNSYQQ